MIKIMQKYLHIPGKQHGDCWRACIASIIECDIEDIPKPVIGQVWMIYRDAVVKKLKEMGYTYKQYDVKGFPKDWPPEMFDNKYIIASGQSPRTKDVLHAVVWYSGCVHDPHPDNTGIGKVEMFEIIEREK